MCRCSRARARCRLMPKARLLKTAQERVVAGTRMPVRMAMSAQPAPPQAYSPKDGGAGGFLAEVAHELNACRSFERVEWPRGALSSSSETGPSQPGCDSPDWRTSFGSRNKQARRNQSFARQTAGDRYRWSCLQQAC